MDADDNVDTPRPEQRWLPLESNPQVSILRKMKKARQHEWEPRRITVNLPAFHLPCRVGVE